jgi:hypothetical protein
MMKLCNDRGSTLWFILKEISHVFEYRLILFTTPNKILVQAAIAA